METCPQKQKKMLLESVPKSNGNLSPKVEKDAFGKCPQKYPKVQKIEKA
jgi:hypothetical protein